MIGKILAHHDDVRAPDDHLCQTLGNTNYRLVIRSKSVVKPMGTAHSQVQRKDKHEHRYQS